MAKLTSFCGLCIGLASLVAACAVQPQQGNLNQPARDTGTLAYDNEMQDFGIAQTSMVRTAFLEAPTPTQMAGATTITTPQLRDMLAFGHPPVLVDVIGGTPTLSLPGAVWVPGAGLGVGTDDQLQQRLASLLSQLTGGDKAKALVFFCLSKTCWLSYNAGNRAVALGYTHVYWYRGGRNAWRAASLPMEPVRATPL